eukprot:TRINITY_DN789_c1_g1_i6.p1 TRINITY_DN789_c1_g1~~TRINITY_DN789_c1_g1_i6.p1  ORF type:complete len:195 (-),score=19.95 TRINITY_DN789_c1_g1_i6:9-593(-)
MAAASGNLGLVNTLLEVQAEISARDDRRWTPLHEAASAGHTEVCHRLLQEGACVEARTNTSTLPLHYIVVHECDERVAQLFPFFSRNGQLVNATNNNAETPLHYACGSIHDTIGAVRYLVENGAEINILSKRGASPLHRALMRKKKHVVTYLLEHGAEVSEEMKGSMLKFLKGDTELGLLLESFSSPREMNARS